jgi:putative ABC transport system substrate-binding protein
MRRRDFIVFLGGVAVAYPLVALAQQADQLRRISVLGDSLSDWAPWIATFVERLHELGWVDGRTIAIAYRWSEARPERVAEAVATFVKQNPDVIVTYGAAATIFKKAATSIPIVFAIADDPLGSGLIDSLSHPSGNMTGLSIQQNDTAGRRLELLREVVPNLRRLAIMFDGGYRASVGEYGQIQALAQKLGFEASPHEIRTRDDIAPVFDALKGHADALYIVENALTVTNRGLIVPLALGAQMPTITTTADFARTGGLISYGPDFPSLFRRAAELVDKILRGAGPGELPVEQPTKFDLVIKLKTAKALGIDVPNSMQLLADEVIE